MKVTPPGDPPQPPTGRKEGTGPKGDDTASLGRREPPPQRPPEGLGEKNRGRQPPDRTGTRCLAPSGKRTRPRLLAERTKGGRHVVCRPTGTRADGTSSAGQPSHEGRTSFPAEGVKKNPPQQQQHRPLRNVTLQRTRMRMGGWVGIMLLLILCIRLRMLFFVLCSRLRMLFFVLCLRLRMCVRFLCL